ncbi:MAG: ribose 5-phosphate isomerase B [Christensenellales bacterium]|nr:ribose 5-phosphate isomerase B [Clostridiales bacterium]
MRIGIGADHGGFVLKEAVIKAIESLGHEYKDYGTYSEESCDYPDYALKVAAAVKSGEVDRGILLCGTGIGICIAANKVKGIRCGHVTDVFSAKATAAHNDANIISMGGRITSPELAQEIVKAYLTTPFESGRHQRRIDKITAIENNN